jgi:enediyne biosynthesis thioesterase
MRFYEYRHVVSFQETNLVGNVYFTHHLAWQGRCRELFLRDRAPDVIAELSRSLALATVSCSCEYFVELTAFDEVIVRMRLAELVQNRMRLVFEYWRLKNGAEELVARGEQQIACMRRNGEKLSPAPVPQTLREALAAYAE